MSRLRILAIAYACDPTRGSEFGVGWGWVNATAGGHDVTVIAADLNASGIEQQLRQRNCGLPAYPLIRVGNAP